MNGAHILAITRREVRETLGDWRVVLPMLLLTLVLPQLLVAAANQVVRFVDDAALAERLIPFAALLVGFIPASFSLIAALESFVGERERNTLESLLAMPLSDSELYLGKLISSLFTPLLASLIAMLIFTGLLLGFLPDLYFGAMDLSRLALLVLLVACMAVVMVTGAVVISAHITTVRAANLMSSFILVPMAGIMQIAALLIINSRWSHLWMVAAALVVLGALLVRVGMRTFSREELLSREHRQGQVRWWARGAAGERRSRLNLTAPAALIARRELLEVVSDWRVLVPLFALTLGLPAALVVGTGFALGFVENERILGRLVPFAALLVGFVPASFALITAIESFVGERERNTLESLLSMPLSDRQLYAGKLFAALLVPLAGSLTAMLAFLAMIRVRFPDLYAIGMQPAVLPQLVLMIAALCLLMVAGAVVISTHTGSIRAATLLASAVLVPTAVAIQLQVLLFIGERYDVLWYALAGFVVIAVALIRSGLASFNREEILSREHEELSAARLRATFLAFFREHRPAGTVLSRYAGLPFSPGRFYRRELPALLRELRLPILCALLAVLGGVAFGVVLGQDQGLIGFGSNISQAADSAIARLGTPPEPSIFLAAGIFLNNLRISILSNLFSAVSFGLFAFMVPAVAFGQVGFIASRLVARGGSWLELGALSPLQFVLAYVLPHGLVELPAFVLSAALGLRIGAALMAPPRGFTAGQNLLWALATFTKVWMLVLVPLIALSALIEGLVTPRVIMALYGG
ncbi:MAG: ABC transporter permease subunit [Chloroflexales bacterium]|nr:ABC transporter permease subunit [Chloroflexales bacterium]